MEQLRMTPQQQFLASGLLQRYAAWWPAEAALVERFLQFATAHEDCLLRSCVPGHLTASAWILSPDGEQALLLHHRKLGRWLQPGGHCDGEPELVLAALREAREESGMQRFAVLSPEPSGWLPLDLDIHAIPARAARPPAGGEPAHLHYDVRFLLQALPGQELCRSEESHALAWFAASQWGAVTQEPSVLRLAEKARDWCRRGVFRLDPGVG
jgi:8-oxo-dGTP pyrophosphatase MutT (NUDIX family)